MYHKGTIFRDVDGRVALSAGRTFGRTSGHAFVMQVHFPGGLALPLSGVFALIGCVIHQCVVEPSKNSSLEPIINCFIKPAL